MGIAFFCVTLVAPLAQAFDFGPRPFFHLIDEEGGRSISGMYTYQYVTVNAHTFDRMRLDAGGLGTAWVETTDLETHFEPHHQLNLTVDLFPGANVAFSYVTNQFNQDQDDSLSYDELKADLHLGPWYLGYRRVSQETRTYYKLRAPAATKRTSEELEYDTRLDIVKFGILSTEGMRAGRQNQRLMELYGGITYIGLDTALPAFKEGGEGSLVAESFKSRSLGLTANVSFTSILVEAQPGDNFLPYLTFGYSWTFFGITRMNDEWVSGMSLGYRIVEGEGVLDTSFEAGLGAFLMNRARFDMNLFFNGVAVRSENYEQILGKGGLAFSLEIQI
ncbi:hypothetical protein SAMN05920897_1048 [Alkalispirochaeta americana]|uniref:MetA-pathway of phenol degradation n=1 Tax=Alkalispirochaeta americana TaxID=159291 RepID=A0A1N6Q522_9SPIO|nr:hypothetical protein SAMN05920897_1048 [Alkalispirochaeta americana]